MEFIFAVFVILVLIFIYKRFTKPKNQYFVSGHIKTADGIPGEFRSTLINAESKEEAKQKFLKQFKDFNPLLGDKEDISVQLDQDGKLMAKHSEEFDKFMDYVSKEGNKKPTYRVNLTSNEALNGANKEFELETRRFRSMDKKRIKLKVPPGIKNGAKLSFGDIDVIFDIKGN